MTAMKKWWLVGPVVILFVVGVAWKIMGVKNCTDEGGVVIAPITGHQECARR